MVCHLLYSKPSKIREQITPKGDGNGVIIMIKLNRKEKD